MADIELVIKIPEQEYNYVKTQVKFGITNPLKMRIANGTPLPKGHGRLIDADKLKADIHMNKRNRYATQRDVDCTFTLLNGAPTIIEADKESED